MKSSDEELRQPLQDLKLRELRARLRLSGASRKRYRYLIRSGMEREAARIEAQKPLTPSQKMKRVPPEDMGQKRPRSEGNTPEGNPEKRANGPKATTTP